MFAYAIVVAHSIIPHHHHHTDHEMTQASQHDDHEDNDQDDDSSLAHEFGQYKHSSTTTDVYKQPDIKIDHSTVASVYIITSFNFFIKPVESPPPIVRLSDDCIPLAQHFLSTKGLRAPPCV